MRLFPRRGPQVMSCAEVGRLLQRYLDDELDPMRSRKIADHLDDCRRCGLEVEIYERIKFSLAARGTTHDDDPLLARLRAFAEGLLGGDGGSG